MGAIGLRDVSFCYRDNEASFLALEHIDLAVAAGEFLCLVGHSGCGKSTLLSLVAGLAQPDLGEVRVDGERSRSPGMYSCGRCASTGSRFRALARTARSSFRTTRCSRG